MNQNEFGFTLTELMVTVSIAAILLALATPSFRETMVRNRLVTQTNEFIGTLLYARSEAIRRGRSISICKSNDGTACDGTNWEDGWIAFLDTDADGSLNAGETILRTWPALPSNYTLRATNNFTNFIRYKPDGTANTMGTFVLCYQSREIGAKAIVISRLRPRLALDTNNNDIPEKENGDDISSCENP